jgi:excisionase family DNA binding protein
MLSETLFTVPEAAAQLRLSPWTIWDLLRRGELMRTKVAGKTFLRESELKKLIVDQINPPRAPRRAKQKPAVA